MVVELSFNYKLKSINLSFPVRRIFCCSNRAFTKIMLILPFNWLSEFHYRIPPKKFHLNKSDSPLLKAF